MHAHTTRAVGLLMTAAILSSMSLPACSWRAEEDETQVTDVPADVLVRGAEPGGMTDTWTEATGTVRATLRDDGQAFYKSDGEETAGMWLMSSPTEGELMLADGRSFRMLLDEASDSLSVIDMSDGSEEGTTVATLGRAPGSEDPS